MSRPSRQHPEAVGISTWDLVRFDRHQKLHYAPKFQSIWMKIVARVRVRVFGPYPIAPRSHRNFDMGPF